MKSETTPPINKTKLKAVSKINASIFAPLNLDPALVADVEGQPIKKASTKQHKKTEKKSLELNRISYANYLKRTKPAAACFSVWCVGVWGAEPKSRATPNLTIDGGANIILAVLMVPLSH